jgi:hypothetical protein
MEPSQKMAPYVKFTNKCQNHVGYCRWACASFSGVLYGLSHKNWQSNLCRRLCIHCPPRPWNKL